MVRQDYPEWKYFSGTKLASMGKYSKDIISSQGVSKKDILLTGSVEIDQYLKNYLMEYNLFNPNQHSRKPIILFASQPYVHGAFASSKRIKSISKYTLN